MARCETASPHEHVVCRPSAVAGWYREQVDPKPPFPTPAADQDNQPPDSVAVTTSAILAKLRAPYDAYCVYLKRTAKRLTHPTPIEPGIPDEIPSDLHSSEPCTYDTTLGILTFAELVARTRKYAASVLRQSYQVEEMDIDDGLQAGYLRLWQRLQAQPELLVDKSLAWIGKGIIFTALHATRGDWQFQRHTQADGEEERVEIAAHGSKPHFAPHSRESRQTDIQVDIHQAIRTVAEQILAEQPGKRGDYDLWALYGLTMLQVSASETSRLFAVREQSMQAAYQRVRKRLQEALPNYAPLAITQPFRQHGRTALPRQDMTAIRKATGEVSEAVYAAVKDWIAETNADTRQQDEAALEGICQGIPAAVQARASGIPQWRMQRAYSRVSLLVAAQHDPQIRVLRPERRVQSVFTLTSENVAAVEQLALELLGQPRSFEKLVALHAHIGNLAISTTAKHFNIPTSTLRYYAQQIGKRLQLPTCPAREARTNMSAAD